MAQARLWAGRSGCARLKPPVGRNQRPENHLFHNYMITRAIQDVPRNLESLAIIHRVSPLYWFRKLNRAIIMFENKTNNITIISIILVFIR